MPWVGNKFVRTVGSNPTFSGDDVWQDDQKAGIKVIAARHDIHDEDLALGIANTLNLDGLNAMRSDLDMGGFCILNECTDGEEPVAEGIWTPTLPAGMSAGGNNGGVYTRIGGLVFVSATIQWVTNPQTAAVFVIGGLPFTISPPANGTDHQYGASFMGWDNMNLFNTEAQLGVRGMRALPPFEIEAIVYIGLNSQGGLDPEANSIISTALSTQETTGEFSFTYTYKTNDAFP